MAKKILALMLAAMLLICFAGCDDEPVSDGSEIDVSTGGFFDDYEDTTDNAEAVDTDTNEAIDTDTDEVGTDTAVESDTDTAETAE